MQQEKRMLKSEVCHARHSRRTLRFAPAALAASLLCQPALSATRTWDAGAGAANPYWDLVANWNTGLPLVNDIANLGAFDTTIRNGTWALQKLTGTGTLTLDGLNAALSYQAASSVGALVFNRGAIGGAGTLTVGNFTWSGGDFDNDTGVDGTINVNGTSTIGGFNFGGAVYFGQALNLKGNSSWTNSGSLTTSEAKTTGSLTYRESSINVFAGKTFSLLGGTGNDFNFAGTGAINNAGTIIKTGSNELEIYSRFNNTGTFNVKAGRAIFRSSTARVLGGTINVAGGATLEFASATTFAPALALAGNGDLVFNGSYNVVTSGTRSFGGTGTKELAGGALGGAGTMVFNRLIWTSGGSMGYRESLGGTTTVNGTTSLDLTLAEVEYGRTLNLNGDANWETRGVLKIEGADTYNGTAYGQSAVNLAAGATMRWLGDASESELNGEGTFNNAGTFSKAGANDLLIESKFNNTGIVIATKGTIQVIGGSFNNTGTLHANGGRIDLPGALLAQWNPTSKTLTGGTYRVTGSQPIALALGNAPGTSTPAVIKTNRAKIYLKGAAATLLSTTSDPDVNALAVLATNQRVLSLIGGAKLTIANSLANKGTAILVVGSGSALTLGGAGVYSQTDTAGTFIGGTINAKNFVLTAGSLSAGNAVGLVGSGVLNASVGGVSFGAAMLYDLDLATTGWDTLSIPTGNLVVDGTLQATFGAGVTTGTYRFLTTGTGTRSGSFDSVTSNLDTSLYTVAAVYGAKFVDLKVTAVPAAATALPLGFVSAVPEPQTWALFVTGLALLGWRLRRRQGLRNGA
jgi:hypothetical protein